MGAKYERTMKKNNSKSMNKLTGRDETEKSNISQQIHNRANEIGGRERQNDDQVSASGCVACLNKCVRVRVLLQRMQNILKLHDNQMKKGMKIAQKSRR